MVLKMSRKIITLNNAVIGKEYLIVRVGCSGLIKKRILDLGLIPGSKVKVLREAPLGDPLEIMVSGFPLSIRRAEAACIFVEEVKSK